MNTITPTISINIITWNSQNKLSECLKYLLSQEYPREMLDVVLVDGGSSDGTTQSAKLLLKNKIKIKIIQSQIKDQEPKRAMAALKSTGKYICSLDPDVYLTDPLWLKNMVEPLENNSDLIGSQTLHYCWSKDESSINRYFALFGFNDPVAFYLNKTDRAPYYKNSWHTKCRNIIDRTNYFEVEFQKQIPTMGCNGVLFRRKQYLKMISEPNHFFHIDIVQDLVDSGLNKFAIVKNCVLHSTGTTFLRSILKRISYMDIHYHNKSNLRHYLVFDPKSPSDRKNIILFVIFTLTGVQPLFLSTKGFLSKPDFSWFLHWPMCLGFLVAYSFSTIKVYLNKNV